MNLVKALEKDAERKSLLKHPFYQLWNKGELTMEALREYAKQYYHFTDNFPRYVASVFKNCTDSMTRRQVINNLVEEELGDFNNINPHSEQWLKFCNALKINKSEVVKSRKFGKTKDLLKIFEESSDKDFLGGVACVLAYEMQIPRIAQAKKQGLKKFYGFREGEGLEFFNTHMEADIGHSNTWKKILTRHKKNSRTKSRIRKIFNKSLNAQWAMLDGILERTMPHSCK